MKILAVGLLTGLTLLQAGAEELKWTTDLPKAQAQAKMEKKLVLMDFTGSDWCPPCKALKKNVLSSQEFLDYAKKNLVLVEVDFPRLKKLPAEQQKANQALQEKFKIEGYPTVIVLDGEGKQLSKKSGYGGEKPAEFIARLEKLQKN